jgi:DNA-binding transcriptional ArsR family regulator
MDGAHPQANPTIATEADQTLLFEALADPTRRAILHLLCERTCSVQEIAAEFPVSRPAISKHLRVLRAAGLVVERQHGRFRYHELCTTPLEAAIEALQALHGRQSAHQLTGTEIDVAEPGRGDDGWRCW